MILIKHCVVKINHQLNQWVDVNASQKDMNQFLISFSSPHKGPTLVAHFCVHSFSIQLSSFFCHVLSFITFASDLSILLQNVHLQQHVHLVIDRCCTTIVQTLIFFMFKGRALQQMILLCTHGLQIVANIGGSTTLCVMFVKSVGVQFFKCFKDLTFHNANCLGFRVGVL